MSAAPAFSANSPTEPPSPERDALDRILRAQVLDRAPNLILFLRYICAMQTSGRTDSIKEYNIAVEALGRSASFDPKKDSIVRVEAHRLRKRLAEYYQAAGSDDPVEILLPPGTYIPTFRFRERQPATSTETESPETVPLGIDNRPVDHAAPKRAVGARIWYPAAAVLALVAIGLAWMSDRGKSPSQPEATRQRTITPVGIVPGQPVRIAAGERSTALADRDGNLWQNDAFVSGGAVITASTRPIRRTADPNLYLMRREGDFTYAVPVPPGFYEVRLHFAETVFGEDNVAGGGESSRVFGVQLNGSDTWIADIISEASGSNTATIRVYRGVKPGADGSIRIAFRAERKEAPILNGIEILPTPDARMLPLRMLAQPTNLTIGSGQAWSSDQYWLGGLAVKRHESVSGPEPSMLYQGERYGNFSYALPVAVDSTYTVTLRFAESWFGEGSPGAGGVGSRVFDVYCNGRALLRNFDVLKEAGGPLRQVKKVFPGLLPNAQGKLNLQFVPIRNYAMVNAIEVVDDGK